MNEAHKDLLTVPGFKAAAVKANIRYPNKLDLALIVSETPASVAGVFTTSQVKAAPVLLSMERVGGGLGRAILVNSSNANACTGEAGVQVAAASTKLAADTLGIPEDQVLVASTGVIGEPMNLEKFAVAMPDLVGNLSPAGFAEFARAIMTTDTVQKTAFRKVVIDNRQISVLGLAKGSGMIMPNMATMLGFVLTDAAVGPALLHQMLESAVENSFNKITVDGDTSTNDTVLVMANGVAGNQRIVDFNTDDARVMMEVLDDLLQDLARQIVADGEGMTKLVTIRVVNAVDEREAEQAARTIANSPLVKTAFFGEDANWGRIVAALGRSGISFDQFRVDISFDKVMLVKDGLGQGKPAEAAATEVLRQKEFIVTVDVKTGDSQAEILTCDLSLDYIRINADYRS